MNKSVYLVVEVIPVSMAELWRVMKQSRRSSLSSLCQQPSTSIIQAERQVREGESPVQSAHRGYIRVIPSAHQIVIAAHNFRWNVYETTGQEL